MYIHCMLISLRGGPALVAITMFRILSNNTRKTKTSAKALILKMALAALMK